MILAIDLGSTSFKAAVFDRELQRLGAGACDLSYLHPTDDASELAVDVVHDSLTAAVADAMVGAGDISAIGITAQAQTFTVCDADGRAKRPFISWLDGRATDAAVALAADERLADFAGHTSFASPSPAMQVSLLAWLREAEPDLLVETDTVTQLSPYVVGLLSGAPWMDENLAAMSGLYSMKTGDWWEPALEACGVRREQLPRLCRLGTSPCSTDERAVAFGLEPDVPIVLAGNDQTAGAYGAAVHATGALLITLGTSEVVYTCCDAMPAPAPGVIRGVYPDRKYYGLVVIKNGEVGKAVEALGTDPTRTEVLVAGGGSRSPERVRQLADALGTEVTPTDTDPLLGAAGMCEDLLAQDAGS